MKIIGLTGFAKSGKSTAAEILKSMGGHEVPFAKHLKDVCSITFGLARNHFDDQNLKEVAFDQPLILYGHHIAEILKMFAAPERFTPQAILTCAGTKLVSPRHVAQYIGTELLRSISPNIHIETAFSMAPPEAKFLICSDVRFMNELAAVGSRDGIVIGISRKKATPTDLVNLHPSEIEVPNLIERANFTVYNELTIQAFQDTIQEIAIDYLNIKNGPVGTTEPLKVDGESTKVG